MFDEDVQAYDELPPEAQFLDADDADAADIDDEDAVLSDIGLDKEELELIKKTRGVSLDDDEFDFEDDEDDEDDEGLYDDDDEYVEIQDARVKLSGFDPKQENESLAEWSARIEREVASWDLGAAAKEEEDDEVEDDRVYSVSCARSRPHDSCICHAG